MKILCNVLAGLVLLTTLSGCNGAGMNKQTGGTVIGGVGGALLGSQFGKGKGQVAGAAIGALAGALVGGQIGAQMDEYDRQLAAKSAHQAFEYAPTGNSVAWQNPDSGHSGSVTPTKTYKTDSGQYCREFQQDLIIGGEKKKGYGTACRQQDGHWKIVQ